MAGSGVALGVVSQVELCGDELGDLAGAWIARPTPPGRPATRMLRSTSPTITEKSISLPPTGRASPNIDLAVEHWRRSPVSRPTKLEVESSHARRECGHRARARSRGAPSRARLRPRRREVMDEGGRCRSSACIVDDSDHGQPLACDQAADGPVSEKARRPHRDERSCDRMLAGGRRDRLDRKLACEPPLLHGRGVLPTSMRRRWRRHDLPERRRRRMTALQRGRRRPVPVTRRKAT